MRGLVALLSYRLQLGRCLISAALNIVLAVTSSGRLSGGTGGITAVFLFLQNASRLSGAVGASEQQVLHLMLS